MTCECAFGGNFSVQARVLLPKGFKVKFTLQKVFSQRRSGHHAVVNWLIGLEQENTLFIHALNPGSELLDNQTGVSLPPGTKAFVERVNGKKVYHHEFIEAFREHGGRLLLSFEKYNVGAFEEGLINAPVVNQFGAPVTSQNILVIRNPFNMLPSFERLCVRIAKEKGKDDQWITNQINLQIEIWKSFAFLHVHPSITRGQFTSIIFDNWVANKETRDDIAYKLGYQNKDLFMDFVSDAGGGSSFGDPGLNAEGGGVLNRWNHASDDLKELVLRAPELIDYVALIFGENAVPKEHVYLDKR